MSQRDISTAENFITYFNAMVETMRTIVPALDPLDDNDKKIINDGMDELCDLNRALQNASSLRELSKYVDIESLSEDWDMIRPSIQANANKMIVEFSELGRQEKPNETK